MFLNPEHNLINAHIGLNMIVADFGAGSGYYAVSAAKLVGQDGQVFCVDINKDLLEKISKEASELGYSNIKIINGDVEKPNGSNLKSEEVDMVVVANTLFCVEDKEALAREALRVLKKGGRVLLVEWSDSFAGLGPHKDHIVSEDLSKKIFEKIGFNFLENINAGDHHYGLIFRK